MYLGKDIIENLSGGYFLVKFIIIKLFFSMVLKHLSFSLVEEQNIKQIPCFPSSPSACNSFPL